MGFDRHYGVGGKRVDPVQERFELMIQRSLLGDDGLCQFRRFLDPAFMGELEDLGRMIMVGLMLPLDPFQGTLEKASPTLLCSTASALSNCLREKQSNWETSLQLLQPVTSLSNENHWCNFPQCEKKWP
jgi:hypothetical protein